MTDHEHAEHLDALYDALAALEKGLGGKRRLSDCHGRMSWPGRGVYFFFEPGEFRAKRPGVLRVVRVGTHAVSAGSRTTLWARLHQHQGTHGGGGNHRGSIFRLHVGAALLARDGTALPTWGKGGSALRDVVADERDHEARVSAHLGAMRLLWLEADDGAGPGSIRAQIERNAIGLLSRCEHPLDPPSDAWLGLHSPRETIRRTGLWNLNHTVAGYDRRMLDILGTAIKATVG